MTAFHLAAAGRRRGTSQRRPSRRSAPLPKLLVFGLLVPALVAGCGGLPRTGPVLPGSRIADDPRVGLLRVMPEGPRADEKPADVVRGFLLAGGAADDDHATARTFLTHAAALRWRPGTTTTVLRATPVLTGGADLPTGAPPDAVQVVVAGDVQAQIDATGHYEQRAAGTAIRVPLVLRREAGQWRVDEVPDGVLVTELDASRTLREFPVYFSTSDGYQLVADDRWFPYDSATATRIVAALLAGPAGWLAPAVATGAPAGTRLRVGTVPVAAGVATVELTDAVLQAAPAQRALLMSQLRASLVRLPGLSSVRVTVRGAELSGVPASPEADEIPSSRPPADGRLVLLGPEGLSRSDDTGVRPVTGAGAGLAKGGDARHPAVSPDGGPFALLDGSGRTLSVQPLGQPTRVLLRAPVPLAAPSVDREGYVWTVPETGGAAVLAESLDDPRASAVTVAPPADGLGGKVLQLRVSRDSSRVLLVVAAPDGSEQVRVHGIVRDAAGRPLRLAAASPEVLPGVAEVLDASWLADDRIALLARLGPGQVAVPVLTEVSGPPHYLPPVADAISMSAGWNERDIVVGTQDNRLFTRSGAEWVAFAQGHDPGYPG